MSTNSNIKLIRKDGTETSIYCHWDGYIEHNGVILQLAYNTEDKIEQLLALGNLSVLGYYLDAKSAPKGKDNDVCIAYHRDGGEKFKQSTRKEEFNYTFDASEGVWYVEYQKRVNRQDEIGLIDLKLDYYIRFEKKLLLTALKETDLSFWEDDEFAKRDEVFEACKAKAWEAREPIYEKELEEYETYWD